MSIPEIFIHVFACLRDAGSPGIKELQGVDPDDREQPRHFIRAQTLPDDVVDEEDFRLGMVDQIVDITGLEFVQNRYGHGAIRHRGQKTYRPVDLIAGANRHLVSLAEVAFLKSDVQFFDASCHVTVTKAGALVVRKRLPVPVLPETFLQKLVD